MTGFIDAASPKLRPQIEARLAELGCASLEEWVKFKEELRSDWFTPPRGYDPAGVVLDFVDLELPSSCVWDAIDTVAPGAGILFKQMFDAMKNGDPPDSV